MSVKQLFLSKLVSTPVAIHRYCFDALECRPNDASEVITPLLNKFIVHTAQIGQCRKGNYFVMLEQNLWANLS
jgi:hypothetical protein